MSNVRASTAWRERLITRAFLVCCLSICLPAACKGSHGRGDAEKNKRLFEAIEARDIRRVKQAIREGADVNAEDDSGTSALVAAAAAAAARGNLEILELLLDNGANPNKHREGTRAVLDEAILWEREEIVLLLIERGAAVKEPSSGHTYLHGAAFYGFPRVARELIRRGLDPQARGGFWDRTPLHEAARGGRSGCLAVLRVLLANGAKPSINLPAKDGATALHLATRDGHKDVRDELLAQGASTGVPLLDAAARGDLVKVKKLLESDRKAVEMQDSYGWTALHWAAVLHHREMVQHLLERGADPNVKDKRDLGPLYYVADEEEGGLVRLLVERGTKVSPEDETTISSLHRAIWAGNMDNVKLLLSKGADPKSAGASGYPYLHTAAGSGRLKIARLLISRGVDVNALDRRERKTPLHLAVRSKRNAREMIALLLANGADASIKDKYDRPPRDYVETHARGLLDLLPEDDAKPSEQRKTEKKPESSTRTGG